MRAKADGDADDTEPGEKRADVETEGCQGDNNRDNREYIDTGRLRGTVEGMSLRSVRLRHQNGQVDRKSVV